MRDITVEVLGGKPVSEHAVEIVERKGVGHPDSICDAIMERVSIELSREYLRQFGFILHHNIDKGFLVAGNAEIKLGGGRVTEPMRLIFGDRATYELNGKRLPIGEIATSTAKRWIKEHLRFVDAEEHVRYDVQLKPGSPELVDIFNRESPGANDTSGAVDFREYYDLTVDPWQLTNLYGDGNQRNDPWAGALGREVGGLRTCVGQACSDLLDQPGIPLKCPGNAQRPGHHLVGSEVGDSIGGFAWRNVMCGRDGKDNVRAKAGRDRLIGGQGRDTLVAGPGRDFLDGGPGRDVCRGGPGKDRFKACEVETG